MTFTVEGISSLIVLYFACQMLSRVFENFLMNILHHATYQFFYPPEMNSAKLASQALEQVK
ncbi:MAG TPA: hypothetical protein V6C86_24240 [Oculatellaceae cyanobacterium]